jgi:hypothetical protein
LMSEREDEDSHRVGGERECVRGQTDRELEREGGRKREREGERDERETERDERETERERDEREGRTRDLGTRNLL